MKKIFLLFLLFFAIDSFASGIASNSASAPCTNNTLETYSGNSNLAADWQPNEIKLRWYDNNTLMDVQASANTCIYDGTLTIPSTAPTRIGYTFDGWTVKPEMDFGTIPTNIKGIERWGKGIGNYCLYETNMNGGSAWQVNCSSDDNFSELQQQEWKVRFNHGSLYGMSICSTTAGAQGTPGTPAKENGTHCWCKATGYKATNTNEISGPTATLSWIFEPHTSPSYIGCAQLCAARCALYVKEHTSFFMPALLAPAQ